MVTLVAVLTPDQKVGSSNHITVIVSSSFIFLISEEIGIQWVCGCCVKRALQGKVVPALHRPPGTSESKGLLVGVKYGGDFVCPGLSVTVKAHQELQNF